MTSLEEKKMIFVTELKETYQYRYDGVCPVPDLDPDGKYCVNDVFVDSDIAVGVSRGRIGQKRQWKYLDSYHHIFNDGRTRSARRIVEGPPGCGKTILTLQLAYDWCNQVEESRLSDKEILLIIQLQQVRGGVSFVEAVKQLLLPSDSCLTKIDIDDIILEHSASLVIILDSYDEYKHTHTDINEIIAGKRLRNVQVMLMTRSPYLPTTCPPGTEHLMLSEFTDAECKEYICNVGVSDDEEAQKIHTFVQTVLPYNDFMNTKLFFCAFTHLAHGMDGFLDCHAISILFQSILSCLDAHFVSKMNGVDVTTRIWEQSSPINIGKFALENLKADENPAQQDTKLRGIIGQDAYSLLVSKGILTEERLSDFRHSHCRRTVKFSHKVYCEWYAACHVSGIVTNQNTDIEELFRGVDPVRNQCFYRFLCGMNYVGADIVTGYLKRQEDAAGKIIELCIKENPGNSGTARIHDPSPVGGNGPQRVQQEIVGDETLQNLSGKLTGEWRDVGRKLGMAEHEIYHIEEDNQSRLKEAIYNMLIAWKRKKGTDATCSTLAKSLIECGRRDLADSLDLEHSDAQKEAFISELKTKYKTLYGSVQPIPYIKDKLYCVDKVFVEGGIQLKDTDSGIWVTQTSYQNALRKVGSEEEQQLIEGEPGYGKSTLSLQLAYDWCNGVSSSPVSKVEILIFLRLRQLGGVTSIYRAIRQFILPKDSEFSEDDVKKILKRCKSVLMIFDGFDEYPDQDRNMETDVMFIINREILQHIDVLLLTRPSCLPTDLTSHTKRARLTGFDGKAQDRYIRKAVVFDDAQAALKIKMKLKDNPVLGDLCQVPLFFVMFAHMTYEREDFQSFKSVTSFFRYMISCFHNHMRNKHKDASNHLQAKFDQFERNHEELNKVAYEALGRRSSQIIWERGHLRGILGHAFYDQYLQIGILVEEEVLEINDKPGPTEEHIRYKTEVRFYHKLFCEWYAAHHLAFCIVPLHPSDDYSKMFDPYDLQYLFRFACGLNSEDAAPKLIDHFRSDDRLKFSILCTLEGNDGESKDILKSVEDLAADWVHLNEKNSKILQRSTIQLLEIASKNQINIFGISLRDVYQGIDRTTGGMILRSGDQQICLPKLELIERIQIFELGKVWTSAGINDVFGYACECSALKELRFVRCLFPRKMTVISSGKQLLSMGVNVTFVNFIVNLETGQLQDEAGKPISDEAYEERVRRNESYEKQAMRRAANHASADQAQ